MAARQQQKGTGLGIQYEDLIPKSEWRDQPEATILTINLPGFAKEQIKVTYVHSSKMIRVTGERPVADRKWSRFNEVFTVPTNCLVDKIHGSFKNNVLTITMPKETSTQMANLPEASKTVDAPLEKLEEKRLLEEAKRKEKVEEAEQNKMKLLEEREGLIMKLEAEAKAKEKAEVMRKLQEEAKAKEKAEVMRKLQEEAKAKEKAEVLRKLQEEVKAREKAEMMRKLQEEAEAKEKAEVMMRKFQEEAKAKEKAEERKLVEEATQEKMQERKFDDEVGGKEKVIIKAEERKLPEVVYTKYGTVSGGVSEMVKSAQERLGNLVEKEKKKGKEIMEKIREKEITGEEKTLMVNVGVAALVIFALGAYVSYSFCSSSSSTKPE